MGEGVRRLQCLNYGHSYFDDALLLESGVLVDTPYAFVRDRARLERFESVWRSSVAQRRDDVYPDVPRKVQTMPVPPGVRK